MSRYQGPYRRGQKYVVVKHVRISEKFIAMPGTIVPNEEFPLRATHIRSLYRRRRLGIIGSDWARNQLEAYNARLLRENEDAVLAKIPTVADIPEEAPVDDTPEFVNKGSDRGSEEIGEEDLDIVTEVKEVVEIPEKVGEDIKENQDSIPDEVKPEVKPLAKKKAPKKKKAKKKAPKKK